MQHDQIKAGAGLPQIFARLLPLPHLDPDLFRRARAICAQAGVTEQSLLDACTLDVTVIGTETAAEVFAGAPPPIAVVEPTP